MVVMVVEQEVLVEVLVIVLELLRRQLNLLNQVILAHTDLEIQVVVQVVEKVRHLTVVAEAAVALVLQVGMEFLQTMVRLTQMLQVVPGKLIQLVMEQLQYIMLVVVVEKVEEIHQEVVQEDKVVELLLLNLEIVKVLVQIKVEDQVEFLVVVVQEQVVKV